MYLQPALDHDILGCIVDMQILRNFWCTVQGMGFYRAD